MLGDWPPFWPAQFPPETINKASPTNMEVIIAPPSPFERSLSKTLQRVEQSEWKAAQVLIDAVTAEVHRQEINQEIDPVAGEFISYKIPQDSA
jgi:hypothetical protein